MRPIAEHVWLRTARLAVITCDDCDLAADYEVTARWPAGHVWRRETCLVHLETGIEELRDIRPEHAGKPTIAWVGLARSVRMWTSGEGVPAQLK
jgi:hypothetical protein